VPRALAPTARSFPEGWRLALLILLPLVAYARLSTAGFIWDDDTMLTANPLVRAADGLGRIWFSGQPIDYWPVTYSSFWLEWRIWGLWAPGYHLTNVLLHLSAGVVLWRLLVRIRLPGAYFAALWFALHPLNVESVAWIAQRKNLLAMLFFLLSLRAFAQSKVTATGQVDRWCAWAWLSFVLAMLSKGSVAPLPLVLAGWVVWHRRLRWQDGLWLGGFLLAAAVFTAVNLEFSHKWGGEVIRAIGWPARLAGAGAAIWFYAAKIVWPFRLCFVYPGWTVPPLPAIWWGALALAVVVTAGLMLRRKRGARPELAAWLYFVTMLLPVLGLVDVYFMRFSLVADHYAHLALVGVIAWAAARVAPLARGPAIGWGIAAGLGALTFAQTALYQNNLVLFRSVLDRNPGSILAHNTLGNEFELAGQFGAAETEYRAALALSPDDADAHNNLGSVWSKMPGRRGDAIAQLEEALRLRPGDGLAHYNLANAWAEEPGRGDDAAAQYREALRLEPDNALAHYNLGNLELKLPGRQNEAIAQYRETLRLRPDLAEAHNNLGNALSGMPDRANEAAAEYQAALRLKPDYAEAHYNLGNIWMNVPGRMADAAAEFETALRLRPDNGAIHFNLAIALLNLPGRTSEAAAHLEAFLRFQPDNATARQILAQIRSGHP
jgi:tetratricopeptide (TPR) repeat protein